MIFMKEIDDRFSLLIFKYNLSFVKWLKVMFIML